MRKKISIALLAFSLAMICANFIVRRVGRLLPPPQQEIEEEEKDFIPFVPVKQKNEDELVIDSYLLILQKPEDPSGLGPKQEKEVIKPILNIELTEEEKKAVETYSKNPKVKEFIKEISTVISQEELDQENYLQVVYKPEVRNIFMKYSQDEEFRNIAAEIMKNKDLLQLTKKIINNNEVKK
jgi:hypothetical protein